MSRKLAALIATGFFFFVGSLVAWNLTGYNDSNNWQVVQSAGGTLEINDGSGYYYKGFATVFTYPRVIEATYDNRNGRDERVKVTFNDAGTAHVSSFVRVALPITAPERLHLHKEFKGNPENIVDAVFAHLTNCLHASSPVMSASENQSSRTSEFNQIVEGQLMNGLYKMNRTEIELQDLSEIEEVTVDANGNKITREKKARVQATEIVRDKSGLPIVIQETPLAQYGLQIRQFSITDTEFDDQTLEQFKAKKGSYLAAESAKAHRQEEVQQRLMIEERGRRQVAEIQAEENQKKERATINATQQAEVAEINKRQAVTLALQQVEVASQQKAQAVIQAQQLVEVAGQQKQQADMLKQIAAVKAETAELDKKATIATAEGRAKQIELGGGITEREKTLAEIKANRDVQVAAYLKDVRTPSVVIGGGGTGGSEAGLTNNLMNLTLLRGLGVLTDTTAAK